jgi:hypothetical protein
MVSEKNTRVENKRTLLHLKRFIGEEGGARVRNNPEHGGGEAPVEGGQALLPPYGQEHGHQGPVLLGPRYNQVSSSWRSLNTWGGVLISSLLLAPRSSC